MLAAVDYAAAHASVVSMSWGSGEFSAETSSAYDGHFQNHPGVTFVASSGDAGAPPGWPAVSPNVVAVGGTTLKTLDAQGTYGSEKGWGYGV
jgi:subtilase family serine protease